MKIILDDKYNILYWYDVMDSWQMWFMFQDLKEEHSQLTSTKNK
jgi:hypothetical protein